MISQDVSDFLASRVKLLRYYREGEKLRDEYSWSCRSEAEESTASYTFKNDFGSLFGRKGSRTSEVVEYDPWLD